MMSTCIQWCRWLFCCECLPKTDMKVTGLLSSKDVNDSPKSTRYYTVRRISRVGYASSREDVDSCSELGGGGEPHATCTMETWTEPVQPGVGDMLEVPVRRPLKGRWHSALHVLQPRRSRSKERKNMNVPTITFSSPDIVQDLKKESTHTIHPAKESDSDSQQTNWSRTQSMQDIDIKSTLPCVRSLDSCSETDSTYPIQNKSLYSPADPLYRKLSESHSSETIQTNWSPEKTHPDDCFIDQPHGTVEFSAFYTQKNKKLLVHVKKVLNLSPKGRGSDYKFVAKLCVLPNEKHTKTTEILTSPQVEEDFHFTIKEPLGKVLRISVFNADTQGKYDAVGNALFNLEDVLTGKPRNYSMKLYKRTQADVFPGNILVNLKYQSQDGIISVGVDKASNLLNVAKKHKPNDKYNTFVKVTLFCAGVKIKSKKSGVVVSDKEPQYNYTTEFRIIPDYFDDSYIVISIMSKGVLRKDLVIGRLILGPQFYSEGHSLTPWGQALLKEEDVIHWFRMYL